MKNYFKKFSIMFVMLLAVIGVGAIQNESVANAATVGQQLVQPEEGWKRYDDTDKNISYTGAPWDVWYGSDAIWTNGITHYSVYANSVCKFNFTGNKIRIITEAYYDHTSRVNVKIDGNSLGSFSERNSEQKGKTMSYENINLSDGEHYIELTNLDPLQFIIDAVDIDSSGKLMPYNENVESILLDKSTMNLTEGDSGQLTATITPAGSEVVWSSSDSTIATVDSNGKVTGVKEGTCTITATTADGLTAACAVTVTKANQPISGITLNKTSDLINVGQTDNLVATTTPASVAVTWISSDTSIATVDSNGKVTAVKEGQAIITATTTDGSNLSASCTVNVTNKTVPVEPEPTENEYIVNTARAKGDNTNNASGEVSIIYKGVAEAQLSVVKTADVQSVFVGDNFTYTIVVTNTGVQTAKAVVINDNAPNHIDFIVSGTTTTQGKVDSSSTSKNIIVNVGDIPPSETVTITVPATVVL